PNYDAIHQVFRMFAHLKKHPESAQKPHVMYDGSTRCFDDLLSHQNELSENDSALMLSAQIVKGLAKEGHLDYDDNGLKYILRLLGIWTTNAFGIRNERKT